MAKLLELNADNEKALCLAGKALSSPIRIQILKVLYYNSYNIGEIAKLLSIPASSAALHVRCLEEADLIHTETQPGSRGAMKLCHRKNDYISIRLVGLSQRIDTTVSISMPVGAYTDSRVAPTCGLCDASGIIGFEDRPYVFFMPERINAQLLWSSSGYVEYKFPYLPQDGKRLKRLALSFEACSEAPNFREDWKSDISVWINGVECAMWRSPGDYGLRRGRLTPDWWENGSTQYGLLNTVEITEDHTKLNDAVASNVVMKDLGITDQSLSIAVRIGNKDDAEYIGGYNLFGKSFGDYAQDIIMTYTYG